MDINEMFNKVGDALKEEAAKREQREKEVNEKLGPALDAVETYVKEEGQFALLFTDVGYGFNIARFFPEWMKEDAASDDGPTDKSLFKTFQLVRGLREAADNLEEIVGKTLQYRVDVAEEEDERPDAEIAPINQEETKTSGKDEDHVH